jgi:hypothetical protein
MIMKIVISNHKPNASTWTNAGRYYPENSTAMSFGKEADIR